MNKRDFLKMSAQAATLLPMATLGANRGFRLAAGEEKTGALPDGETSPSYYYLQSAQDDLVIDINNSGGVHSGSALQALVKKTEANQLWTTADVPGKQGYFWIISADPVGVIDINNAGGIKPGSKLQVLEQKSEDNQYWTAVDVPDMPGYFWLESGDQSLVIDIDNAGGIKSGSALQVNEKKSENNEYWKWVATELLSAPVGGNANYFLADSKGAALTGTTLKVFVTEDIVPDDGAPYAFQFNCDGPAQSSGPDALVWQQFMFVATQNELCFLVNSFREQDSEPFLQWDSRPKPSNNVYTGVVPLPGDNRLPKGWQLTMNLLTDRNSNVTGFKFSIIQPDGTTLTSPAITLLSLNDKAVASNLAPIQNCTALLIKNNGATTTDFSAGKGMFLYSETNSLIASLSANGSGVTTAENSNISYAALPASYPNGQFYQQFGIGID